MSDDTQEVDTAVDQQEQTENVDAVERNADEQLASHEAENQPEDKERAGLIRDLQKERQRRQELEQYAMQMQMQQQQAQTAQQQNNTDNDELLTRGDLNNFKQTAEQEFMRKVMETSWVEDHPEEISRINNDLPELLTKRPELKWAIENAPNRYKAAWKFLNDYSPRQQAKPKIAPQQRPGSPQGVGKSAKIAQAASYMDMSDNDWEAYKAQKRRRR